MPIMIPTTKSEVSEQTTMIREGLQVHDAECCTASEPCTLRKGMEIALAKLLATTPGFAPRTEVRTPAPRRGGSGNGFGQTKRGREATEPQKNMIRKLAAAKSITEYRGQALEDFLATMLMSDVDDARQFMLNQPWPDRKGTPKTNAGVTDGMYRTEDGTIYKVQKAVHGSGRLYAKRMVKLDEPREMKRGTRTHEFVMESGAMSKLTPAMKMTLEEMKEWGKLYGTCCKCGALLTDETSIEEGIGPICGDR